MLCEKCLQKGYFQALSTGTCIKCGNPTPTPHSLPYITCKKCSVVYELCEQCGEKIEKNDKMGSDGIMKANKKTLMAVKAFFENDACIDMQEFIDDLAHDTQMLKSDSMGDIALAIDECIITWDDKSICTLYDFLEKYTELYNKKICSVLDSFVGEDIDCLIEE